MIYTILIQELILIAITFYCGLGFLEMFRYLVKYEYVYERISPSIIYLFGLIPLAFIYSLLGVSEELRVENFLVFAFLVGLPALRLFNKKSGFLPLKWYRPPDKFQYLTVIFLSPILFYGVTTSLMPTSNWDVISYVLSIPKTHVLEGNVRYLEEYGIFSAFPIYGESLIGIPYLLFGSEQIVQLYIFTFLVNLIFISQAIFNHFSIAKLYSFLGLISIAYLPVLLVNLGVAKVEIPQASLVLASLLLLIKSKEWGGYFKILSVILFTFAIGVKYTTIFYFPIYGLIYWRIYQKQILRQVAIDVTIFCLIAIVVNSIWLAINLKEHCNPLFPNLVNFLGSCKYSQEAVSKIMTMVSESTLLQKGTSWQSTHSISAYWPFLISAFGIVNCALLAIVIFIQIISKKIRNERPLLKSAQIGIAIIFFFQIFIYYWEFRYFCLVLILVSIIIFVKFDALKILQGSKLLNIILVILVSIQSLISFRDFYRQNPYVALSFGSNLTQEEFKERWIHLYWVAKYLNENTAPSDVIAFNWGVQPFYYLERKYFFIHDWNPEGGIQEMRSPEEFLDLLKRKQCSYLVWRNQDETRFQDPSISKQFHAKANEYLARLVSDGKLKPIFTKDDVIIYELLK